MERLTFEGNFCDLAMCRENPCPYNGSCSQRETWERLKHYEDLEEQGRLIVSPCKIGDTVYFRTYTKNATVDLGIQPHEVTNISMTVTTGNGIHYVAIPLMDFGESVFLTREEAEAALEGGNEHD